MSLVPIRAQVRVELPAHLRTLAQIQGREVALDVPAPPTIANVLDALEAAYPMLRGTIRDQTTHHRRAFLRFFACQQDISLDPPDTPLPAAIANGAEPLIILGAVAGGSMALPALAFVVFFLSLAPATCFAQSSLVDLDRPGNPFDFPVAANSQATAIYVSPQNPETVRVAVEAFASDVALVTGGKPLILTSLAAPLPANLILVGVLGHSPEIDALAAAGKLDTAAIAGKWESALTTTIASPLPGVRTALVIAASDRRGAAFALFTLSRQMGVSPWTWWADVPVPHHAAVYVRPGVHLQPSPSVQYRGIFLNDEDWGLRPWAAKKMDPERNNIGPHTYARIFELLLRLHANSLWPAMHPGTLAFNDVPENAKLADRWGIVMGSSHSEALLRNNVGEWDERRDGPWNYQTNSAAMNRYWDQRLTDNGGYENFYTVGLRGVHDSGLEATGTPQVKAHLVEDVMAAQRALLAKHISPDLTKVPQIIWLYKESLDLYRIGMKVPADVALGWTDDNYGYLRELPNVAEQQRPGGSGIYYHVSYWGAPHDYLWLCTTPPALIREEMTKAYDHNARRYWILNVGDLKPAEIDIDYFMQLAWNEPEVAALTQHDFLVQWAAEQFPVLSSPSGGLDTHPGAWLGLLPTQVADLLSRYYALNFVRKPEFMGFNGYNDGINRAAFNPLAWGGDVSTRGHDVPSTLGDDILLGTFVKKSYPDQNHLRAALWSQLRDDEQAVARNLLPQYASAFFELIAYPVEASAAMNDKFLSTDLTYLDAHQHNDAALANDTARARDACDTIQSLTAKYNTIENGKWEGIMSSAPRDRHVFEMPRTATAADAGKPLPTSWDANGLPAEPGAPSSRGLIAQGRVRANPTPGFVEQHATVSINAAHFTRKQDTRTSAWQILPGLGISGSSVVYGAPGLLANTDITAATSGPQDPAPWLEYDFATTTAGPATLALHLLPTFAVDSYHHLRYAVALDGHTPVELDPSGPSGHGPDTATWSANVLRNSAIASIPLGPIAPGRHTLRLIYRDPGVVFEHLVVTFPGAPPAYPVPPETTPPIGLPIP